MPGQLMAVPIEEELAEGRKVLESDDSRIADVSAVEDVLGDLEDKDIGDSVSIGVTEGEIDALLEVAEYEPLYYESEFEDAEAFYVRNEDRVFEMYVWRS